jgi:hypothetical protein
MWCFPRLPKELELLYSIYIIYTFLVDDEEPNVSDYTSLVTMGTAPTPFMSSFRHHLDKMKNGFSNEEYWHFLKGLIDFIMMTRIENLLHGRVQTLSKSSIHFPWNWKQLATSAPPHIAMALRSYSDLVLKKEVECELERYMSFVNDLCSWYKERVMGDEMTYEEAFSYIRTESTHDALRHVLDECIGCIERCRKICSREPEMLNSVDHFLVGYFHWHLITGRYQLAQFLQVIDLLLLGIRHQLTIHRLLFL